MGGNLGVVPGHVPFTITWSFNSQDNSNGPLGKGTSLSTDYFIAASAVLGAGYYELIEPGNHHFAFHDALGSGNFTNATDPEALGAVLTIASPPNGLTSTLRWKNGSKYFFDSGGALNRIEDRLGNWLTIARDSRGFPTQITQPQALNAVFAYGENGLLGSVSTPNGATWSAHYDDNNRVSGIQALGYPGTNYTWGSYTRRDGVSLPLVLTFTDRNGVTQIANDYDSAGRVSAQTYSDGGVLHPTYSGAIGTSGYTSVTDPKGLVTRQDFTWNPSHFGYEITACDLRKI